MSELHPLQVTSFDSAKIEGVSPTFAKAGLLKAREKTIQVLREIQSELKVGMTEDDARKLTLDIFKRHGVTKHWHRPYVRFGEGTLLTFNHPTRTDLTLQKNDPYYLDLGPVWKDEELGLEYEGDYGDTFVFGENAGAEKCANAARDLFALARNAWREKQISGTAIYELLLAEATARGYELDREVEGHRVSDFPHHRFSKDHLALMPFTPSDTLWVLEVKLNEPAQKWGAFFEDIL